MQTTRKNVKNLLIAAVCIALALPVSIAALLLLPNWLGVGIIFFIAKFYTEIGTAALMLCIAFAMYKLYRFVKLTENPWQAIRMKLRKNLIILLSMPFIIYACIALFVRVFPTDYDRCDYYNEHLNGGVKEFQGKKFKIHMCGTGGHDSLFRYEDDEIRLQVFNDKGDLVAVRHFVVHWDTNSDRRLEYHPDHITYFDPSDEDFEKTISMPPTVSDWIQARISLFN